jgi:glycosyltransferase involved in cell wall biosynthesis
MKKLRIAQVSTIWETTPPKLYGGTERVVHDLTEELVKKGHKVTLFATGDSKTSAKLKFVVPKAAYRENIPWTNFLYPLNHIAEVYEHAHEFDLIHMHLNTRHDYVALVLAGMVKTPTLITTHFVFPREKEKAKHDRFIFLKKYRHLNYISLSKAQRTLSFLNYVGTVHNGLDFSKFPFHEKTGDSLVWLGRICSDKGTKEAIEVAKKTGMKLILAGKLDKHEPTYLEYYRTHVEPFIDGKQIKYIGEVNDTQKITLLKKAKALLMPINWNEPFGLTTIEAMAMGVPVIAFNMGPMKEIIMDGKTGFVVKNVNEMSKAVKKVDQLNRKLIRQYALSHFSAPVMAENYEKMYEEVLRKQPRK